MDRSSYQVRINQWASIIQAQASSHMNKTEWCRENGITVRTFYYWQRKLRNMILESSEGPSQKQLPSAPDAPTFCELSIPDPQKTDPIIPLNDTPGNGSGLIVEIRDCRIIVGDSVSKDALASVIEVLRHV